MAIGRTNAGGGAWVAGSLDLFNYGETSSAVGGWTFSSPGHSQLNSDHIALTVYEIPVGYLYVNSTLKVDLTKYSIIRFYIKGHSYSTVTEAYVGVGSTTSVFAASATCWFRTSANLDAGYEFSVDISGLSGSYYILASYRNIYTSAVYSAPAFNIYSISLG